MKFNMYLLVWFIILTTGSARFPNINGITPANWIYWVIFQAFGLCFSLSRLKRFTLGVVME